MDDVVLAAPSGRAGRSSRPTSVNPSVPPRVPSELLAGNVGQFVDQAPDGVALLDPTLNHYLYVNPSGCRLLGRPLSELIGTEGPFLAGPHTSPEVCRHGQSEYEYSSVELPGVRVSYFRDVSRQREHERLLGAFSQTSASIAFAESLASVLDRLAEEVCQATGMESCTFLLMVGEGDLRQAGTSAAAYPGVSDYGERLERCRALGAPLLSLDAFRHRRPVVAPGWRQQTLSDPRFAPLHDISLGATWSTLAAVPLISRGRIIGVMNGYYPEGSEPLEHELTFLTAIADQAAVAVENARLLGALESKAALEERHLLARELHDSVNQALFSLTLQTRAMEIGLGNGSLTPATLLRGLTDIRELTDGALAEMRALIFQLRPAALRDEGLVLAVRKHAAAVSSKEGVEVVVHGPTDKLALNQVAEDQLFRVTREALHNVVKHAQATRAVVTLHPVADSQGLRLTVADDGVGFDTHSDHPGHLGLKTMAERVAQIGGVFTLRSRPSGTTITVDVPGALSCSGQPS